MSGCGYCGISGHSIDTCPERLEDKFGTSADPTATTDSMREDGDD